MSGMPAESVGRSDGRSVAEALGKTTTRGLDQPTDRPTDRLTATDRPTARPAEPVIIAESPGMRRAVELARRFAPTNLPVLLVGETGTGKEVLAQAIHLWSGRRGELVDVDCGALPPGMVVAELFGHRRGAYTTAIDSMPGLVEQAAGGTLFLDELASLPVDGQAALLRMLETGEVRRVGDRSKLRVDLRLIAAVQEVDAPGHRATIRRDLYHRLTGTLIYLPPLRERSEDLLPLVRHLAGTLGRTVPDSSQLLLERHSWPGNVRELRHVVARAAASSDGTPITVAALAEALDIGGSALSRAGPSVGHQGGGDADRRALIALCRRHMGRAGAIASDLGVGQSTMYRLLRRHGLRLRAFWATSAGVLSPLQEREGERTRERSCCQEDGTQG